MSTWVDCQGTPPGPEGKAFYLSLAILSGVILLGVMLAPLVELIR